MADMKVGCLFCGGALDGTTKTQHIIPEGVGGTLRTKEVTCTTCNETFGNGIDKIFAQKYQWLLVHLPPELVQGYTPPKLAAETADGNPVWVLPGYRPEDRHFEVKYEKDSRTLHIRAPNEELLKKMMSKHKAEEQKTWKAWEDPGQARFGTEVFMGPEHYRATAKISLEILDLVGLENGFRNAVRDGGIQSAVDYVRDGKDNAVFNPQNRRVFSQAGRNWIEGAFTTLGAPQSPFHHRIWLNADSASGMLIGIVGILDTDYFGFVLSNNWKGDSFEYLYQRSPIAGTQPDWRKLNRPHTIPVSVAQIDGFKVLPERAETDLIGAYRKRLMDFAEYREMKADGFLSEEFAYHLTKHGDAEIDQSHVGEGICFHLDNIFSHNKETWKTEWPKIKSELLKKLPELKLPPADQKTTPTRVSVIIEVFLPIFRTYFTVCRKYIGEPYNFGVIR
jgi:hypothetical protein